jgi:glutamyl-tRNA synthetase
MTLEQTRDALQKVCDVLVTLPDFSHTIQEEALRPLADELGLKPGQLFGAMRNAITAQQVSPPLFETMEILGRDVSLFRLRRAIDTINAELEQKSQHEGIV